MQTTANRAAEREIQRLAAARAYLRALDPEAMPGWPVMARAREPVPYRMDETHVIRVPPREPLAGWTIDEAALARRIWEDESARDMDAAVVAGASGQAVPASVRNELEARRGQQLKVITRASREGFRQAG